METRTICRVCLAGGVRMQVVTSTQLQEVYEKLANSKLETDDGRPSMLCYICYVQLWRCHRFWQAARRSETILSQMYQGGVVYSEDVLTLVERPQVNVYSVSPIEKVDIYSDSSDIKEVEPLSGTIKFETVESAHDDTNEDEVKELHSEVKLDPDCESNSNGDFHIPVDSGTDPEDDVPLNNLKKSKVERQKRKYNKRNKIDAREVSLSKEQQLLDVLSRSTSHNYLHSPYRCELCYRGFVSHAAYENHREKHDERSGPHECDICKMRYRSARLLRTHTRTAHALVYTCNKCGHRTHTKHQASDHERWHKGHTYECQLCSQNFVARTSYLTHVRLRHAPRHACAACGRRFLGEHGLRMHAAKAHARARQEACEQDGSPARERHCASCGVTFASRRAWARHVLGAAGRIARIERTKECPICSRFIQGSARDHMREHERRLRRPRVTPPPPPGGVRVTCDQCAGTFASRAKLSAHVRRVHLGLKYDKNIVCEVCGKKCTSNASLKYHQRTHTGERPHACAACDKRFADGNQLRIHARTHTGERPYSCQHCGKSFAQKPALNRHYRVHTGAKPYTCELCSKSFSQSNSLKVHVRAVHLKMPAYRRKQTSADVGKSGTNVSVSGTDVRVSGTEVGVGGTEVGKSDASAEKSADMKLDQELIK